MFECKNQKITTLKNTTKVGVLMVCGSIKSWIIWFDSHISAEVFFQISSEVISNIYWNFYSRSWRNKLIWNFGEVCIFGFSGDVAEIFITSLPFFCR